MKFRKTLAALTAMCIAVPAAAATAASGLTPYITGDVNGDCVFNLADLVLFQRWLRGNTDITISMGGDVNSDGIMDVFDLSAMRKMLINCITSAPEPSYAPDSRNLCAGISSSHAGGLAADEKFINSQAEFTVEMFRKTYAENKDPENTLISPYSIMQALAMTANGANGKTRTEMENVLGGGMKMEQLNKYLLTQRLRTVNNNKSEYNDWQIDTANSIWAINDENRIKVRPTFLQNCIDYYDSEFYISPFDETTLNDVNGWVNDKTHGMIPSILDNIDIYDVMYLVNAVAFEAQWEEPYFEYNMKESKFTAADGSEQDADMLCSRERYIGDDDTDGMIKYYSGGNYAFAALLPDENTTVDSFIENLTAEKLNGILNSNKDNKIEARVELPKFSYEYDNDLSEELVAMGMPTAFDAFADFSEMSSITNKNPIHIGAVIHKTFIELDENGTKAAAATLVAMRENAVAPIEQKEIKDVVLDRPFVYCIIDTETKLPVFIGALNSL